MGWSKKKNDEKAEIREENDEEMWLDVNRAEVEQDEEDWAEEESHYELETARRGY